MIAKTTFSFMFSSLLFLFSFAQEKDVFDIARHGTVSEMEYLIKINQDTIYSISSHQFTPLILACYRGNKDVAIFLIKNSENLNYLSPQGTALAASIMQNQKELAHELLAQGADINLSDKKGLSPLILAIQTENSEMVQLLLEYGADKKQKDAKGITPFAHAIQSRNSEIINIIKTES